MRNFKRKLWIIWVGLVFSNFIGCATGREPISRQVHSELENIGVYSSLGDKFKNYFHGATFLQNEKEEIDVSSWGIDGFVENEVIRKLSDRWVKKKFGRLKFGNNKPHFPGSATILYEPFSASQTEPVSKKALSEGYNHYILVIPHELPRFLGGFGFRTEDKILETISCFTINVTVVLIDARTNESLSYGWGNMFKNDEMSHCYEMPVPWKKKYTVFTPEEDKKIEELLKFYLKFRLKNALTSMGLLEGRVF